MSQYLKLIEQTLVEQSKVSLYISGSKLIVNVLPKTVKVIDEIKTQKNFTDDLEKKLKKLLKVKSVSYNENINMAGYNFIIDVKELGNILLKNFK